MNEKIGESNGIFFVFPAACPTVKLWGGPFAVAAKDKSTVRRIDRGFNIKAQLR